MKAFAFFLAVLFCVGTATVVHGQFFNDSKVINIGEGDIGDVFNPEEDILVDDPVGGTQGSEGTIFDASLLNEDESEDGTTLGEVLVTAQGEQGSSETQGVDASSLVDAFSSDGAFKVFGDDASGGGSLDAEQIRFLLSSRGIISIDIPQATVTAEETVSWGGAPKKHSALTRSDVALIISSFALSDANITVVDFTTDSLTLSYRAFGRLFFFLPHRFTARVAIDFDAPTKEERVKVTFPWYSFVLRTGVSKTSILNQLDTAVRANQKQQGEEVSGFDVTARMFTAVSDVLRARYGSIDVSGI
jgi:hypothetical protein